MWPPSQHLGRAMSLARGIHSENPNPTTADFSDDLQWVENYLYIHQLSGRSYLYAYGLWALLGILLILASCLRCLPTRSSTVKVIWTKWSIRQHFIRSSRGGVNDSGNGTSREKSKRKTSAWPVNAQILSLALIVIIAALLTTVGPDYIAPRSQTTSSLHRRDGLITSQHPDYTIYKAWWTIGGRTGMMAFALFPALVCIALKVPPFAILAIPFTIQLHSDRLMWMHRWIGRSVYLLTVIHAATWTVQLCKDRRHGLQGPIALRYAFLYEKFVYGIIGFACMTLLVLFSLSPLRKAHYEVFYFIHVLTVPSTIIFSAFHYPPLGWFCWSALILWVSERSWRAVRFIYVNGIFTKSLSNEAPASSFATKYSTRNPEITDIELDVMRTHSSKHSASSSISRPFNPRSSISGAPHLDPIPPGYAYAELLPGRMIRLTLRTPQPISWVAGQYALLRIPNVSTWTTHPFTMACMCDPQPVKKRDANAGISGVGDAEPLVPTRGRQKIVFLIRVRQGFTLDLWDHVQKLRSSSGDHRAHASGPSGNVVMSQKQAPLIRAQVDGPFGSAARTKWTTYPTVIIIVGGSGVAFGLSLLEYLSYVLSRKDDTMDNCRIIRHENHIRKLHLLLFWLAHLLWGAGTLRRCLQLAPQGSLRLDLFVTNHTHHISGSIRSHGLPQSQWLDAESDKLVPPSTSFGRQPSRGSISGSDTESIVSETDSLVDLHYVAGSEDEQDSPQRRVLRGDHSQYATVYDNTPGENVADLTAFAGEDDTRAPEEAQFSMSVKRNGRLFRRKTLARLDRQRLYKQRDPIPSLKEQFAIAQTHRRVPLTSLAIPAHNDAHETPYKFPSSGKRPSSPSSPWSAGSSRCVSPLPPLPHPRGNPSPLNPTDHVERTTTHTIPLESHTLYDPHRARHHPELSVEGESGGRSDSSLSSRGASSSRFDTRSLGDRSNRHAHPVSPVAEDGQDHIFNLNATERSDLEFIAALARSGRPRLDRILAEEVNRASGAIAVASCGPPSLTTVVRKVVEAQIHPTMVWRGDERGYIYFFSEEFAS